MSLEVTPSYNWKERRERIDAWVVQNKPDVNRSLNACNQFIQVYGSGIRGNNVFSEKTQRIIEKVSKLATGVLVLEGLLDADKERTLSFQEIQGSWGCFIQPDRLWFDFSNKNIRRFYVGINDKAERVIGRSSSVIVFIHECIHAIHYLKDPDAYMKRGQTHSLEWDDQEEEYTINGSETDFCCENTARRELAKESKNYLRVIHKGIRSDGPNLQDLVDCRMLHRLREEASKGSFESYTDIPKGELLKSAKIRLIEEEDSDAKREWTEIIGTLIEQGCRYDKEIIQFDILYQKIEGFL